MKGIIEPITLEQLLEMNGKPVYDWIGQQWFVIDGVFVKGNLKDSELYYAEITMSDGTVFCSDLDYDGISGRFYVYPPSNIDRQAWVSVNERMPDEDQSVIVIANGKPRENITLDGAVELAEWSERDGWFLECWPDWENPVVTHWMPIPVPPEEAERCAGTI